MVALAVDLASAKASEALVAALWAELKAALVSLTTAWLALASLWAVDKAALVEEAVD